MKRFACADGSVIEYRMAGMGRPIVFIHGWSVDHRLWANKIESVPGGWKRRFKRIYFDLPGMGKSTAAQRIRNSDAMLEDIEEFLRFSVPEGNYLLAGESYGGYLARGLLKRQKARIDGLFLLCPLVVPGWRKGRVAEKAVLERDDAFLSTLAAEERKEFDYLSVIQTAPAWRDYKRDIHLDIAPGNEGFLASRLDGSFSGAIDISDVPYDRPALILLGRQDTEVGFEDQVDLYAGYQRATIQVLDKAGHNLQIERKSLFNASFLDWLERVESCRRDS